MPGNAIENASCLTKLLIHNQCWVDNLQTCGQLLITNYMTKTVIRVARFSQQNPPNCYSKLAQSRFVGGSPVKIAFRKTADLATLIVVSNTIWNTHIR